MASLEGPLTGEVVAARAALIRERIARAGGDPDAVQLVAVTKGFGVDVVRAALDAGLLDLGENYAQEMVPKAVALDGVKPAPVWHFMGRLQTNKVRMLAPHIGVWQSVDREGLLREIANRVPRAPVLIQVNISGEEQKGGCPPDDVAILVDLGRELGLEVRGLMGVGPAGPPEAARPACELLSSLADDMDVVERSMGMSDDLEVAVAAGATMVRIGRDLFGPRPSSAGDT
jgi:pyridoxal phosphate enzyme (YggS family)